MWLKILTSPLYPLEFLADVITRAIMTVYVDSLEYGGVFSKVAHKLFSWLMTLVQYATILRTCLAPLKTKRTAPPAPPDHPSLTMSATEIARAIRHRKIKAEEVVSAFINRINQVNPLLNCLVEDRFKEALKEAKIVDELLSARPNTEYWKQNKPLLGVPITVKESIAVKGMSNNAARTRKSDKTRARDDAECVSLMRRAGAIPIAVTTTPEMCMNWECYNSYQGVTRNPYDTRRVTGGSSGGEAGLLGAGASVLGLGSDLAGSLRLPAFFCGIFAHKSTAGYVPVQGHVPEAHDPNWYRYFCIGPMTRYAEDLPLSLAAMIPERNKPGNLRLDEPVDLKKLKVYYIDALGDDHSPCEPIDRDVNNSLMQVIHHFKISHNVQVTKIKLKEAEDAMAMALILMGSMRNIENIYQVDDEHPEKLNSILMTLLKGIFSKHPPSLVSATYAPVRYIVSRVPQKSIEKIHRKKERIQKQIEDLLQDDGILLVPTFIEPAPYHFRMLYKILSLAYLAVFNLTELPATHCPVLFNKDGLPIGIQVVASRNQDRLCLAAAKSIQEAFGGWRATSSSPPRHTVNGAKGHE